MNLPKQEPRPTADDTRLIPLSQGQFATVDAADFDWLSQWKWHAMWQEQSQLFYAVRHEGRRPVYMHREILGLKYGDKREADHITMGDGLDNRHENLRIATKSQNRMNTKLRADNTSGFKGVSWDKRRSVWTASTFKNGKHIWIGSFPTAEEAHGAYWETVRRIHGEFAQPY